MLVNGSDRYVIVRDAVKASGSASWVRTLVEPDTLILAGNTLFVGGRNTVMAINKSDGSVVKQWEVDGDVHALAFADGRLMVSTHTGKIYGFE